MAEPSPGSKSRLFLSYSRQDSGFADELVISLESYEFEVVFDREDLFPGEPWEPRLRNLISDADTTVCVVSKNWIASDQCARELAIAQERGRRVIPAVIDPVNPSEMPGELSRLQFVFFHGEGHSYARGVVALVSALRTDIGWVREQSRLMDKAEEWTTSNRSKALLLRGATLERALEWIGRPAPPQTHIAPIVAEYVEASRKGQDDDEKGRLRDRVRFAAIGFVAAVAALFVTAGAGWALVSSLNKEISDKDFVITAGQNVASYDEEQETRSIGDGTTSDEEPTPSRASAASLVAMLNSDDRAVRLEGGQLVAARILERDNAEIVGALVAELQGQRLEDLEANGRFNVLYLLNAVDAWPGREEAGALAQALDAIERRAADPARPIPIGGRTQVCIDQLQRKLAGERDGGASCGA